MTIAQWLRLSGFLLLLFAAQPSALAVLTIEIIGSGEKQFPIAIVPFRAEEGLEQKITPVVAADLARSGLFKLVDAGGVNPPPSEPEQVDYAQWRARGAEAVVIGTVSRLPDGRHDVRFRL
ncbi:MAG: Tol-Pal system protein TolB, partial [Betaproteobacteria bacterium]|nr:Tol-Pal system protein TolB [Betaproteobacteria bacterium]